MFSRIRMCPKLCPQLYILFLLLFKILFLMRLINWKINWKINPASHNWMNCTSSEFPLLRKTGSGSPWEGARLLDRDGTIRQEKWGRNCDFIQVWQIGGNGSGTTNMAPDPIHNNLDIFMISMVKERPWLCSRVVILFLNWYFTNKKFVPHMEKTCE